MLLSRWERLWLPFVVAALAAACSSAGASSAHALRAQAPKAPTRETAPTLACPAGDNESVVDNALAPTDVPGGPATPEQAMSPMLSKKMAALAVARAAYSNDEAVLTYSDKDGVVAAAHVLHNGDSWAV